MPKGPTRGHRAPTNAPAHDDPERWVETVIASLPARSTKDREALLKALVDGDALPPETHPVSGTISPKTSKKQPLEQQARADCNPLVSPITFADHGLNDSNRTQNGKAN